MRIPAIYILLLLAAAVVLAFALEFVGFYREAMRTPISEAANKRWWPPLDRRVLFRLALVGGGLALALVAAILIGHSVDRIETSLIVRWVLDYHPSSLLLAGVLFCLLALLCGVKWRQPVLLFCLTLPGLVIVPLLLLPEIIDSFVYQRSLFLLAVLFFLQPGVLILLPIGIGQSRLLRKSERSFTPGGFVRLSLISVAYVYGFL